jgi:Tol biopolymer transport system component
MGTEIQSNLYKVSMDGGDPVPVTSFSGNVVVSKPSFSPDGNSIAFSLLKSSGEIF